MGSAQRSAASFKEAPRGASAPGDLDRRARGSYLCRSFFISLRLRSFGLILGSVLLHEISRRSTISLSLSLSTSLPFGFILTAT